MSLLFEKQARLSPAYFCKNGIRRARQLYLMTLYGAEEERYLWAGGVFAPSARVFVFRSETEHRTTYYR